MPTFGFDQQGVRRIVESVRRVEQLPPQKPSGGKGTPGARDYPTPMHLGKLSASLSSTGSAAVTLWGATQASTGDEVTLGTSVTAYNWSGVTMSSGSNVMLFRHYGSGRLYAMGDGGKAKFIEFELQNTITSTDQFSNVILKDSYGGTPPSAVNSTIEVYNTASYAGGYWFTGKTGYNGLAVYDDVDGVYTIWNIEPPRSSDFVEVNFTPVTTSSSFVVTVTFFPSSGKTAAGIESSIIINFLNSSNIVGFSTAVASQVLTRTSTGMFWNSPSTCTT